MSARAPFAAVAAVASALAGCASDETPAASDASRPVAADDFNLGTLSSRELASGQCGLFLWSRTQDPQLVFFSNPETGEAAIVVDGREQALRRLTVDAPTADGRSGAQTFATESGDVSARLAIQQTEPVENGYRVASASLRVLVEDGWSGVIATAGLAACQP